MFVLNQTNIEILTLWHTGTMGRKKKKKKKAAEAVKSSKSRETLSHFSRKEQLFVSHNKGKHKLLTKSFAKTRNDIAAEKILQTLGKSLFRTIKKLEVQRKDLKSPVSQGVVFWFCYGGFWLAGWF